MKYGIVLDERIRCFAVLENGYVYDHLSISTCVYVQRERLETRMTVVDRWLRYEDRLDLARAQVDLVLWMGEVFAAISGDRRFNEKKKSVKLCFPLIFLSVVLW